MLGALVAQAGACSQPVEVHLVDPCAAGSGHIWRVDQDAHLVTNTRAGKITAFAEPPGAGVAGGLSLLEWAHAYGTLLGDAALRREARTLTEQSYISRRLVGTYQQWAVDQWCARTPAHWSVEVHPYRAVALDQGPGGVQHLRLATGQVLALDALVLTLGHLPVSPDGHEQRLAAHAQGQGLVYQGRSSAAEVDVEVFGPGQPVILRGLGACFFDYLALFTRARGGRFVRHGGRLHYVPSGGEPVLIAGSRRGVPGRARIGREVGPPPALRIFTAQVVEALRARRAQGQYLSFGTDVWPLIATEAEGTFYASLIGQTAGPQRAEQFWTAYGATKPGSSARAGVVEAFVPAGLPRWNWEQVARPAAGRRFADAVEFHRWLLGYLYADLREARRGRASPGKAAEAVLGRVRHLVRRLLAHGGVSGVSYCDEVEAWYTPLYTALAFGPPAFRLEQMIALVEAGVLTLVGPNLQVEAAQGCFRAFSPVVGGAAVQAGALIEARLPPVDLDRTTDPLLGHLHTTGQVRAYGIANPDGSVYVPGGVEVTEAHQLVDAHGRAHPRRFLLGIPTEGVHWRTPSILQRDPGLTLLPEAEATARALLAVPLARP